MPAWMAVPKGTAILPMVASKLKAAMTYQDKPAVLPICLVGNSAWATLILEDVGLGGKQHSTRAIQVLCMFN
jgi:hypothetical protein